MRSECRFTKRDAAVLVVCAAFVLANLGAIGSTGRRRAKEAVCAANLKRLGQVLFAYAKDHGGYFMNRTDMGSWYGTVWGYYENLTLLLCPEATRTPIEGGMNPYAAWTGSGNFRGSYVINLWLANSSTGNYWRSLYVRGGESVPMFSDGQWTNMEPYPTDLPPANEADMWTPNVNEMRRACVARHNGGVDCVFLDGSVRKVGLKGLWRLTWYRAWPEVYPPPVWPAWMANIEEP